MQRILFINGSPNKKGNTVAMVHRMFFCKDYETLHRVDYKIYPLGQTFSDDQFDDVMRRIAEAYRQMYNERGVCEMRYEYPELKGKELSGGEYWTKVHELSEECK